MQPILIDRSQFALQHRVEIFDNLGIAAHGKSPVPMRTAWRSRRPRSTGKTARTHT
jgi:hypothetical protein